jgi:hypothetical protein
MAYQMIGLIGLTPILRFIFRLCLYVLPTLLLYKCTSITGAFAYSGALRLPPNTPYDLPRSLFSYLCALCVSAVKNLDLGLLYYQLSI